MANTPSAYNKCKPQAEISSQMQSYGPVVSSCSMIAAGHGRTSKLFALPLQDRIRRFDKSAPASTGANPDWLERQRVQAVMDSADT